MSFRNRIRLPLYLSKPQFPEDREVYRRADGVTTVQSVVVRKVYEGATDYMPEKWHERLKIALAHDQTVIEGEKYFGNIVQDGDYNIAWLDKFNYPTAPATFKAEVSPFAATNSNCQTCEEASQLHCVDDTISDPISDGDLVVIDVIENDSICCFPTDFSIRWYDNTYVQAASIDEDGIVTIQFKTPLVSANNLKLATYRATCPNGQYDEADIFGNVEGSEAGCLAPLDVELVDGSADTAKFQWIAPTPAPALGYHYYLYTADNPGTPVGEGDVLALEITLSGLDPETDYKFYIVSHCDEDTLSNAIEVDFTTPAESAGGCGQYLTQYNNPAEPGSFATVTFINCFGDEISLPLVNGVDRLICALESAVGTPVSLLIDSAPEFQSYNYVQPCG